MPNPKGEEREERCEERYKHVLSLYRLSGFGLWEFGFWDLAFCGFAALGINLG